MMTKNFTIITNNVNEITVIESYGFALACILYKYIYNEIVHDSTKMTTN